MVRGSGNVDMGKAECLVLPHRDGDTAALDTVKIPSNRATLLLALDTDKLYDTTCNELTFNALSPNDRATFQLLLYLTYCCKGELLQVTLENPDFRSMSPAIREDFSHGRLFCFVLDMETEDSCEPVHSSSDLGTGGVGDDTHGETYGDHLLDLMDTEPEMDVFRGDDIDEHDNETGELNVSSDALNEAFSAFMRLQLVRKRASSLNNAMILMRDGTGELSSIFDWVDIQRDTLNSNRLDKKKVKDLQGSMYTPNYQSGKQGTVLPQCISDLNLKAIENSIGKITDSASGGDGKPLFMSLMSKLSGSRWLEHKVMRSSYNVNVPEDVRFLERLKLFASDLQRPTGERVETRGLLVFKYSLDKLSNTETPDLFVKSMIHRYVPIAKSHMKSVLREITMNRRTRKLADVLHKGQCHCKRRGDRIPAPCEGDCQTAYACFYNISDRHPFLVTNDEYKYHFAHLYPHLGKLERLSNEMKIKYKGRGQFESISEMVFNILMRDRFREGSLYRGLSNVLDNRKSSSLSLSGKHPEIHELLYLRSGDEHAHSESGDLAPIKIYDHAMVRYLFTESLNVGRLFQASTTFNYIIANTAPRYTLERIMLFNI